MNKTCSFPLPLHAIAMAPTAANAQAIPAAVIAVVDLDQVSEPVHCLPDPPASSAARSLRYRIARSR